MFLKKISFMTLFITLLLPVYSESQVEVGINVPMILGVTLDGENVSEEVPYFIPLPDLMYNYYFNFGHLRLGAGLRAWTVLVASGVYPIVSAELYYAPFLFNAHIGGGFFAYTSIGGSGSNQGNVFLPEISASVRLTDWFSLGTGVLGFYVPDFTSSGMGYAVTLISRFRVSGPGK